MEFDPKVTVEGMATAIGVFAGALAFVYNLVRGYIAAKREKRQRADRLTIMEILEQDLSNGLSEKQIKESFASSTTEEFRKKAGASNPSKLKNVDFAVYLRDLQWASMIDQTGQEIYRLRVKLPEILM